MNRTPSDSHLRDAVASGMSAVQAPPFDLAAIQTRSRRLAAPKPRAFWIARPALILAPVAAALVLFLTSMPSVVAQVERVLRAFAVINGQTVPLSVRSVSLAEAEASMPFHVIVPGAIPAGLKLTISALSSDASPANAHLIFEYRANPNLPVLTIEESAQGATAPTKMMITERHVVGHPSGAQPPDAALPPLDAAAPGKPGVVLNDVEVKVANGHTSRQALTLHPDMWVQNGTRIVLAAMPDGLNARQIAAIRASMSR